MRAVCLAAAAGMILAGADLVVAQTADRALTPAEAALACGPPPSLDIPQNPLQVIAAQDTVSRTVYGQHDVLVIGGGTSSGVQLGQQYFIRRALYTNADHSRVHGVATPGWIRIVAVNETTAVASVERFCGAIHQGDYLEPFVIPAVAAAEHDTAPGELDFNAMGHVLMGADSRTTNGPGDLMLIDRGADQGVVPGLRFAVYRDLRGGNVPLASIGEGVVLSTGKTTALARITRSRDAVVAGDYVVPRK